MKKTFCDRCGKECDGAAVQRFTIFDVNRSIDVCDDCYQAFFRWLNNKPMVIDSCDMNMFNPEKNNINDFIKKSLTDPQPMDNDKLAAMAINTLKNCEDDPEGVTDFIGSIYCENCEYNEKLYWEYPCRECCHCREDNKTDHYIRKEKNNDK